MIDNQTLFTTSYRYGSTDEEFVFACKGRPFAALISDILPTPDTNLIDHNLVRELGLKMTNLQCRKFHFAGHKMRVLGRVSTALYICTIRYFCTQRDPVIMNAMSRAINAIGR